MTSDNIFALIIIEGLLLIITVFINTLIKTSADDTGIDNSKYTVSHTITSIMVMTMVLVVALSTNYR